MRLMRAVCLLVLLLLVGSCNSGERVGKDPYCEFVNGTYTYNLDLRRTISYQGIDFDFTYYDRAMQECISLDAKYVHLKGIGHYYDEKVYVSNDIEITYSSIMLLPDANRLTSSYLNILTTLQAERIMYLMRNYLSYKEAKRQSKEEIYHQIMSSDYFSVFDFNKDIDFSLISMNNELLSVITKSLAKYISNTVKLEEDKSVGESVWDEYILNYSLTGNMALSELEPQKGEGASLQGYLDENKSLKACISRYRMPFKGGVPRVKGSQIYYGIDTNTFVDNIKGIDNLSLKVKSPEYHNFECNGYFDISANIRHDSLSINEDLRIYVKNLDRYNSDTTYIFKNSLLGQSFSSTIWLDENARYNIDVVFGRDSLSYRVENRVYQEVNDMTY